MKLSNKALLASIFIFPGAGHIVLKRHKAALVIILFTVVILGIFLFCLFEISWAIVNDILKQDIVPDYSLLRDQIREQINNSGSSLLNGSLLVLFFLWIISIVDTWRLNRRR